MKFKHDEQCSTLSIHNYFDDTTRLFSSVSNSKYIYIYIYIYTILCFIDKRFQILDISIAN